MPKVKMAEVAKMQADRQYRGLVALAAGLGVDEATLRILYVHITDMQGQARGARDLLEAAADPNVAENIG